MKFIHRNSHINKRKRILSICRSRILRRMMQMCQKITKNKKNRVQTIRYKKLEAKTQKSLVQLSTASPYKIIDPKMPILTYPKFIQMTVHSGNTIQYKGDNLFFHVPFEKFIQYRQKGNMRVSAPQMELEPGSYQIPQIVANTLKDIYRVNLWAYKGQRYTSWHYDGHDNFLYQLEGIKIVYITPPQNLPTQSVFSTFSNHLKEKFKISLKNNQTIFRTVLGPKQCVFIPKGWWHSVVSKGKLNIALNFWGNSISQVINNLSKIEKYLVIRQLTSNILDNKIQETLNFGDKKWEDINQHTKQTLRYKYWHWMFIEGFPGSSY